MKAAAAPALVERIGNFAGALSWDELPPVIQNRTRDRILDALSTAVAGQTAAPYRPVAALLANEPSGPATVLPTGAVAGAGMAAFANGVAAHALLYEDLNLESADHPGVVIVPAVLAAAEAAAETANIRDLLLGVVAGYEVQLFLGALAGRGVIARGFRTTSVFGTVAAAVAAAKARRMPAQHIATAAAIGANFAGGLTEGWSHGSHEPYLHAGAAAQQGLLAAQLAECGALHAAPTFEGPNGYLRAFADLARHDTVALPGKWRIADVICKPYPCSGGKVGAIDSAQALFARGLDATAIESVSVWLPALYHAYPGASRVAPFVSMSQAQASGQFCVAATLLGYDMEAVETFVRDFANEDIAALSHKIELLAQPGTSLSRVEVNLADGTLLEAEIDRRDRWVPSVKRMAAKLVRLTTGSWPAGVADRVVSIVTGSVDRPIGELSALLRRTA